MLPENEQELFYRIALTFVKDVGAVTAQKLVAHYGTASDIFNAPLKQLKTIAGMGEVRSKAFKERKVFERAEKELEYIEKNNVDVLWCTEEDYPERLKNCVDAPVLLYYKGDIQYLNCNKVVAVVGTRKFTDYGQRACEKLIEELKDAGVMITSGLAHGIDTIAHKAALNKRLPTVGVVAHGMDKMYPAANRKLAEEMQQLGGVLTEYGHGAIADKSNFPMRNRIVAGMSDVTVVVESDIKGGALITAKLADSYNRDVAAFPGRVFDKKSSGCNELIRTNMAAMITSADDLLELMNWDDTVKKKPVQKQLFISLSDEEQAIYKLLTDKDSVHADEILHQSGMSNSKLAATLLGMEMQGLIKALPGKYYRLD